jgi:hypothetical protein
MTAACEFDHLIVGAHTLDQGAAFIEAALGVQLQPGGRHAAMGTHNMVLKLGPRAYLEVIALDRAGAAPSRPRWFALDDSKMQRKLRASPRLLTWAARTQDIDAAVKHRPIALGTVHPMSRGAYAWRITVSGDGALDCDGLMPALIQWDCSTHPADKLEDRGCELVKLDGRHPAPDTIAPALAALGLAGTLSLTKAKRAQFIATLRGPRGICTITS